MQKLQFGEPPELREPQLAVRNAQLRGRKF